MMVINYSFFDASYYLHHNPDVAEAVDNGQITAEEHFEFYGKFEGRMPSILFDPKFYLAANPDVASAVQNSHGALTAYDHFMSYGFTEARAVSPTLHLGKYLEANPDVAAAVETGALDAFNHLINYGIMEGRSLGNGVSLQQFANDPSFQAALQSGNSLEAMAIVASVAPFLPSFQAPEGWQAPSDLSIPINFVPVKGEGLVIPKGVAVPSDLELPDFIKPYQDVSTPISPKPESPIQPGKPSTPKPDKPINPDTPIDEREQPDFSYSFSHYQEHKNTLKIIGSNLDSILGPNETKDTDIKERIDWNKITLNNYYYGDTIYFELDDIDSAYVTEEFLDNIEIKFNDKKAKDIRENILYKSINNEWDSDYSTNYLTWDSNFIKDWNGDSFDIPVNITYLASYYDLELEKNAFSAPIVSASSRLTITSDEFESDKPSTLQATVDAKNIASNTINIIANDGYLVINNLNQNNTELNYYSSINSNEKTNITASGSGLSYVYTQDGNDTITSSNPTGTYFETGGGNDTLIGGDGNDLFLFTSDNLTKEDHIDGGYGYNYLEIVGEATITDDQFTHIKNIQKLLINNSGNHTVQLGELAGKSFKGNLDIDIHLNNTDTSSIYLDASSTIANIDLDISLKKGDSAFIQGGSENDSFWFNGSGDVNIKFAESLNLNGFDWIYISETSENITLDFSEFLGENQKTALVSNMKEGLDLSINENIGIVYNNDYLYSDDISSSVEQGKITVADNGKAVVLTSSRLDADFASSWYINYIEDINPDPSIQSWQITNIGYVTNSNFSVNGFTANEIADWIFL